MAYIDKEVLVEELEKKHYSPGSMKFIEDFPEVKAIPVDYILEKIEDYYYISNNATPKISKAYVEHCKALRSLMWDWDREQNSWRAKHETN